MSIAYQNAQGESVSSPPFKASGRFRFSIKGTWDSMTATLQVRDADNGSWDTVKAYTEDTITDVIDAGDTVLAFRVTTGADGTNAGDIDWVAG